MRCLIIFLFAICFTACQNKDVPARVVEKAVLDDGTYDLRSVPGSEIKRAERRGEEGQLLELGFVKDGIRHGSWTTYDKDGKIPQKIFSYVDGVLNGPYVEMDDLGRLSVVAGYQDNQLHGPYGKYRIGRPELTVNYVNGQPDGVMAKYNYQKNKLTQEITYKMGKMDGPFRYYNEEGEMTLEYMYKDDERVE